ncbi:hypothetical protein [Halotalea alkalilenta]|uniref:Uncharacterized protein n=1 Tax=Halotalea alkalilenta TaxID=376489 RepID=A0A172YF42_9GAMM|nr:hypothetical protein [Halotalea alkalilenta]ANF57889.1 hypothetical protein A5892_10805 [Halotalea alkalilenta]
MSDTAILEIVELPDGEVVLRPSEGDGEALVSVRFSEQALELLRDTRFEVAREMIDHAITRTKLWEEGEVIEEQGDRVTMH